MINPPAGIKSVFELSQKRINEPESSLVEITQSKKQREKNIKEMNSLKSCEGILKIPTCMLLETLKE